ncbi:DNA-binding response regulator, OmpR family, contains REC and winged-helix (wHTH) domain [Actinokineospora iranica]|uniref:DNA-binding response regulator, OmpR family, contains REC and winged-helix (WHTH) domain n=1 Tax=Actinokineospora iranica TaxID=1271860 RepID=A0A1G6XSA6_9PSEU|nr:DNA-binding response regulator, OmpR family, contains REC and winged-helix (wHTH) domain [Actinokineospora iranica]
MLVLEDDENMRLAVGGSLRGAGFAVDQVADLAAADEALWVNRYDCAVFDRKLPSGDSLRFVRAKRAAGLATPVLFLTALDSVDDRIAGLADGDDYLVKPFDMAELVARVRSLCRRSAIGRPPVLRCGDLELDPASRQVRRGGILLTLTPREFAVLELLMATPGTPVRRDALIAGAWDEMADPTSNILDVVIRQLRRKLHHPPMIHTVHRVGYRIDP